MKLQNKKGFTLIELLVVITIIGILATGATATYTSQIQKARDSTRMSDLKALQWGLEQVYADLTVYPSAYASTAAALDCTINWWENSGVQCLIKLWYVWKLPKDPKSGQNGNLSALDYTYAVAPNDGVLQQTYELSMWVESDGQLVKADNTSDSWNDSNRVEIGHPMMWINTKTNGNTAIPSAALVPATDNPSVATKTSAASCKTAANADTAAGADRVWTVANQSSVIVIKGSCF